MVIKVCVNRQCIGGLQFPELPQCRSLCSNFPHKPSNRLRNSTLSISKNLRGLPLQRAPAPTFFFFHRMEPGLISEKRCQLSPRYQGAKPRATRFPCDLLFGSCPAGTSVVYTRGSIACLGRPSPAFQAASQRGNMARGWLQGLRQHPVARKDHTNLE